jgi:hypothetical protein
MAQYGLQAVRFSNYVDVGFTVEQQPQGFAHRGVIVCQDDPDRPCRFAVRARVWHGGKAEKWEHDKTLQFLMSRAKGTNPLFGRGKALKAPLVAEIYTAALR